jgi:hypothetical protein
MNNTAFAFILGILANIVIGIIVFSALYMVYVR